MALPRTKLVEAMAATGFAARARRPARSAGADLKRMLDMAGELTGELVNLFVPLASAWPVQLDGCLKHEERSVPIRRRGHGVEVPDMKGWLMMSRAAGCDLGEKKLLG